MVAERVAAHLGSDAVLTRRGDENLPLGARAEDSALLATPESFQHFGAQPQQRRMVRRCFEAPTRPVQGVFESPLADQLMCCVVAAARDPFAFSGSRATAHRVRDAWRGRLPDGFTQRRVALAL